MIIIEVETTTREITIDVSRTKVPSGGTLGQVLGKASATSYDLQWIDQTGGGGGLVSSVFGRIGTVVAVSGDYTTDEVTEATDKNYVTDAELVVLGNTSGSNTGDQDISGIAANASDISTIQGEQTTQDDAIALNTAKTGITPTQASDITTNNTKRSYPIADETKLSNINYYSDLKIVNARDFGTSEGTDQSTELQAANDYLASLGGGIIIIDQNLIGRIELSDNVGIEGVGYDSSLTDPDGMGDGAPIIIDGSDYCSVRNIRIDGNKANWSGGTALNHEAIDCKSDNYTYIDNVWVENTAGDGIDLDGSRFFTIGTVYAKNCDGSAVHPSQNGTFAKDGTIGTVIAESCGVATSRSAVYVYSTGGSGCSNISIGNIIGFNNYADLQIGNDCEKITVDYVYSDSATRSGAAVNQIGGDDTTVNKIIGVNLSNSTVLFSAINSRIGTISGAGNKPLSFTGTPTNNIIDYIYSDGQSTGTNAFPIITFNGITKLTINNILFVGYNWQNCDGGLSITGGSSRIQIKDYRCDFETGTGTNPTRALIISSSDLVVVNGLTSGSRYEGCQINNSTNSIVTGVFKNNGHATGFGNSSQRSGVRLMGTSEYNRVMVHAYDDQGTATQGYGVYEENTTGANIVTNCTCYNNVYGQITTNNVNTVNANNLTV